MGPHEYALSDRLQIEICELRAQRYAHVRLSEWAPLFFVVEETETALMKRSRR